MIRFLLVISMLILAAFGIWQLGQAGLIAAKAWAAPVLMEHAFNQSEAADQPVRPWPWADSYPIARVAVPRLEAAEYVLSESNMRNLAFGPTALEIGANTVLFAHRDTHFNFLQNLQVGDAVAVKYRGQDLQNWRVARISVIDQDNLYVQRGSDQKLLLLVTCYPFNSMAQNPSQRFVAWLAPAGDLGQNALLRL